MIGLLRVLCIFSTSRLPYLNQSTGRLVHTQPPDLLEGSGDVIDSKSNAMIKGFNARVEMLRFREEHPGTFHRLLLLWNNVESVFSSMKARFGGVVRTLKERTQSVKLLSMTVCYNMVFA